MVKFLEAADAAALILWLLQNIKILYKLPQLQDSFKQLTPAGNFPKEFDCSRVYSFIDSTVVEWFVQY